MDDEILELIGIYDADSTLVGEVSYWIQARFGSRHCALCELTHGVFRTKREWLSCARELGVPIKTFHRDDAPSDALRVVQQFPVLLIRKSSGLDVLLEAKALDAFHGDTFNFAEFLADVVRRNRTSNN